MPKNLRGLDSEPCRVGSNSSTTLRSSVKDLAIGELSNKALSMLLAGRSSMRFAICAEARISALPSWWMALTFSSNTDVLTGVCNTCITKSFTLASSSGTLVRSSLTSWSASSCGTTATGCGASRLMTGLVSGGVSSGMIYPWVVYIGICILTCLLVCLGILAVWANASLIILVNYFICCSIWVIIFSMRVWRMIFMIYRMMRRQYDRVTKTFLNTC